MGNGVHVIVRQVRHNNMRETLKEIGTRGVRKVIAHLDVSKMQMFLKAVSSFVSRCEQSKLRLAANNNGFTKILCFPFYSMRKGQKCTAILINAIIRRLAK